MALRHEAMSDEERAVQTASSGRGTAPAGRSPTLHFGRPWKSRSPAPTPRPRRGRCHAKSSSPRRLTWIVALREIDEFGKWIDRERPSRPAWSAARTFIAEIGDEPWRAPSVPIDELSNQPEYEVRVAAVEVIGEDVVWVWYIHAFGDATRRSDRRHSAPASMTGVSDAAWGRGRESAGVETGALVRGRLG